MITTIDKFIVALLPLASVVGGWAGFDVTPEWWQSVAAVAAPLLVYLIPNKE